MGLLNRLPHGLDSCTQAGVIEELFKFSNQHPNNIVTELKVAGSKIAFILSDWSNRTAVLHVFDGEVEVLVHALSFGFFEGSSPGQ